MVSLSQVSESLKEEGGEIRKDFFLFDQISSWLAGMETRSMLKILSEELSNLGRSLASVNELLYDIISPSTMSFWVETLTSDGRKNDTACTLLLLELEVSFLDTVIEYSSFTKPDTRFF